MPMVAMIRNWFITREGEDMRKSDPAWLKVYGKMRKRDLRRALVARLIQLDRWPEVPKTNFKDLNKRSLAVLCAGFGVPEPGTAEFGNLLRLVPK